MMLGQGMAVALVAAAACAGGCSAPTLVADDTMRVEGRPSPIRVVAYRPGLVQLGRKIAGVEVAVHVDGREVARGETDNNGQFVAEARLPDRARRFEATATLGGRRRCAVGRVFAWHEGTTVVVDIDQTISNTDVHALIWRPEEDMSSTPLPGAVATLNDIARDCNICYITGRPREVLGKTNRWLEIHGFPAGPVATAEDLGEMFYQTRYKRMAVADAKEAFPHVLIGIGDKSHDAEAYGRHGLLTIVITEGATWSFSAHSVLLPDWDAVGEFFEMNREALSDPRKLSGILEESGPLLRPTLPWTGED